METRRSDLGAGLANPSWLGGFEEFFDVAPSRASSSAIFTSAALSSARNASISHPAPRADQAALRPTDPGPPAIVNPLSQDQAATPSGA